jgi:hypothetical protein
MAMGKELDWTREPYLRRTKEEQEICDRLIEEWVAKNPNCKYDEVGDLVMPTAQPALVDNHKFTPVERLTLDYEGKF